MLRCPFAISNTLRFLLVLMTLSIPVSAEESKPNHAQTNKAIQDALNRFCSDCHNQKKHKGDVRLDQFSSLSVDEQYNVLGTVEEQVYRRDMPPEEAKVIPTEEERQSLLKLLKTWNDNNNMKSSLSMKLSKAEYGNYVEHDKLFSGEYKNQPAFTYDRKWLLSEYLFDSKVNELLRNGSQVTLYGKKYPLVGRRAPEGIANPFLISRDKTGVLYYANQGLGGDTFLTMLGNAEIIADMMINNLSLKHPDYLPVAAKVIQVSKQYEAILSSRQKFLNTFIDDVCAELYQSSHESMLPPFKAIDPGEIQGKKESYGKHGWRTRIGIDGVAITTALLKFEKGSSSNKEMIQKCQRFWAHYGEPEDVIARRTATLAKELTTILEYGYYKGRQKLTYKPLADASEMAAITAAIKKHRTKGMDYKTLINRCMDEWQAGFQKEMETAKNLSDQNVEEFVNQLYSLIFKRAPSASELTAKSQLLKSYFTSMSARTALIKLTQTLLLDTEIVIRNEYGTGKPDEHGRRMLSPRDASYALAYAITEKDPDPKLVEAAQQGRLNTREDYRREVLRLLADRSYCSVIDNQVHSINSADSLTTLPVRKLRFVRDFFGYPRALTIFKEDKRFGGDHEQAVARLISEADMLVEHVLVKDKSVLETLLTTEEFYVWHSGDNEAMTKSIGELQRVYEYFSKNPWKEIKDLDGLRKYQQFIESSKIFKEVDFKATGKHAPRDSFNAFAVAMRDIDERFSGGKRTITPYYKGFRSERPALTNVLASARSGGVLGGIQVTKYFNIDTSTWEYPVQQPTKLANRKGLLTHPAWLIAHAQNNHTDPVIRGRWVREKLLAGTVPDVPVTVDAQIPEGHTTTLRERLHTKTSASECWRCHVYMNPLGYSFEMYDDFGRFRTEEEMEHPDNVLNAAEEAKVPGRYRGGFRLLYKSIPLDTSGKLDATGDPKLDGDVKNALELVDRLAKAKKVRQSFIRHAFRFFMGRNEVLSDSKTLIDADEAYVKSGGSLDAVIVSLLTSDSFIYRKPVPE